MKKIVVGLSVCFIVIFSVMLYSISRYNSLDSGKITLDKSSIPIVDLGYKNGLYLGPTRNPVTTSLVALNFFDQYFHKKDAKDKQAFMNDSNWLVKNVVSRGNYSIFEYNYTWDDYNLKPPWHSGLAQGDALHVLLKAYKLTGESKYLDTARMLLNSFYVDVRDGGVTYKSPKDGWWYEEFPGGANRQPRVLNGMMFAILGIYDFYNFTRDKDAKYLFDQGVLALEKGLSRYDEQGKYSVYDIERRPATLSYNKIHVDLLGKLYDVTGIRIFKEYHDKWQSNEMPLNVRLVFFGKAIAKYFPFPYEG
jgi:heparosan-N-sulfate-glucuronate 5-epimerase